VITLYFYSTSSRMSKKQSGGTWTQYKYYNIVVQMHAAFFIQMQSLCTVCK